MKKLIALILCIAVLFSVSVVAFAAESPTATAKVSVTLRKADGVGTVEKSDVAYSVDDGGQVTVKASADYGNFTGWSIYKSGTKTLAAEGVDYKIVTGSHATAEMTIEVYSDVVICADYDNVKTDPLVAGDKAETSPQTGDAAMVATFVMLIGAAVVFGAKKIYSK